RHDLLVRDECPREVAEQAPSVGGVAVEVSSGFAVAHGFPRKRSEDRNQRSEARTPPRAKVGGGDETEARVITDLWPLTSGSGVSRGQRRPGGRMLRLRPRSLSLASTSRRVV